MAFAFRFDSFTFSDGTSVRAPDGVVVLVGPNNAGKSASLRELLSYVNTVPGPGVTRHVVTAADVVKEGTVD